MRLTSLDVSSVRNIGNISLEPEPGLNVLYGDNGAGKTSLLEAIAILSNGRSFRSGKINTVIRSDFNELTVVAAVFNERSQITSRLGIVRSKDNTRARINGARAQRLSELANALPSVIVSTKNHELVEGGPTERRSFLDWILFHVEPGYLDISQRYKNALSQRNAAIRSAASDALIASWDTELVAAGETIHELRKKILDRYRIHFALLTEGLDVSVRPKFVYRKGWAEEFTLKEALNRNISYCRRVGTTTSGPHRADIKIKVGSNEARYNNSRGQQKLLAIMMRLAQVDIYTDHHAHPPVLLFDDLPSELDKEARKFVFNYLQETGVQVFLTSIDDVTNEIHGASKRFHVKQGKIEKVLY